MAGTDLIVAVVSGGVGLGALTATLGGLLLRGQSRMNSDIRSLQLDVGDLRERMARLEGQMEVVIGVFGGQGGEAIKKPLRKGPGRPVK